MWIYLISSGVGNMRAVGSGPNPRKHLSSLQVTQHKTRKPNKGLFNEKNSKNPRLLRKWVGESRSHSDLFLENRLKIALNQYWYFGVVYHVYYVCIYIVKSCWLLWFECSVHVSDGFPKKTFGWGVGGLVELYSIFFDVWNFLTLQSP